MCYKHNSNQEDDIHFSANINTPLREDAFKLTAQEKIDLIEGDFRRIMDTLGLDLTDDSLKDTPRRVAKMFVNEIFGGLLPEQKPEISTFINQYNYSQLLVEKDIVVFSTCEHHFLPIIGRAHVAYLSAGSIIGLSKINRIVNYYAKRPQVQERLTKQIVEALQEALQTQDVACIIEAKHLCVSARGIKDIASSTITAEYAGRFKEDIQLRREFNDYLRLSTKYNY